MDYQSLLQPGRKSKLLQFKYNPRSIGSLGKFPRIHFNVSVDFRSLVIDLSYAQQWRNTASPKTINDRTPRHLLEREAVEHVEVCHRFGVTMESSERRD